VDLVYIHNAAEAQLEVVGRTEFLRRLAEAFGVLEEFRKDGAIRQYGLATWDCLRSGRSDAGYLALEDALAAAVATGGPEHGLRFLQFPFNLVMPEAALLRNQTVEGDRLTLFEAARRLHLGTFTSVPLAQGQLAVQGSPREGLSRAQSALQFARSAPGTIAPVVGLKQPEHIAENLALAERPPWAEETVRAMLS
jgi:aryl-alcohol dehydrogenase-like predicted oxidoreductase